MEAQNTDSSTRSRYIATIDLDGRRVVVVGGGPEACRQVALLIEAGALPLVIAHRPTPELARMAGRGEIALEQRQYRSSDLDEAWYAVTCSGNPTLDATVEADATRRRVLCHKVTATSYARGQSDHCSSRQHPAGGPQAHGLAPFHPPGVALVGGGPGDADLITVRGQRFLAHADVVIVDRLAPQLFTDLGRDVEIIDASKVPYGKQMSQETINDLLIERARAGKSVVRLKGGDPYVFGRGYEEVQACLAANVPVTVVPGVTSAVAVPSSAGIPLTHRGMVHEFVVASGHVPPGHATSLTDWDILAKLRGTIAILMGIENIEAIAEALIAGGRSPETPVSVIQEGTRVTQRVVHSTLDRVADAIRQEQVEPPSVVVVGDVAAFPRHAGFATTFGAECRNGGQNSSVSPGIGS